MTENFLYMLAPIMNGKIFLILLLGTLFGLILGVLPGLGPTTGGALILPFTMTLEPLSAIILLTSIYCAGTYGGAITAILINTPGTPAAAATCLDGYPLAQKGEAARALGMATFGSAFGGIFSVIVLVLFAPILANIAYEFGQPEYFALDHLLASEYPINEATVPPSAGKIPINEPIPEERKIVLKQYLKSSLVGSFTAFIATLLKI